MNRFFDTRRMRIATMRLAGLVTIATVGLGCGDGGDSAGEAATGAMVCEAVFRSESTASLGALQLDLAVIPPAVGAFAGAGAAIDCSPLVSDVLFTANGRPGRATRVGFITLDGIRGPADLFRCAIVSDDGPLETDDLAVVVVDASTPQLEPVDPPPVILASSIDCTPERD